MLSCDFGPLAVVPCLFLVHHHTLEGSGSIMHLPMFHISSRNHELTERPRDEDPMRLGQIEGKDWLPWLANPENARKRAEMRTPFLNIVSLSLAALGSEVTYFAIMGALFSAFDRKTALKLASAVLPSVIVNQVVKARVRFPRPPQKHMHPYAFVAPGDFTFPSGHAQNAVTLGLFIGQRAHSPVLRFIGTLFSVMVPLSRVYLGVHYPRDVLAGSLLGMASLAGATRLEEPFRQWWNSSPRGARGFTMLFSAAILGLISGTPLAAFPLGVGGGLAVGHDISGRIRFQVDRPRGVRKWLQAGLGLIMFMGAGFAIRPLLKKEDTATATLAGGVVGVTLTLGVPAATGLMKKLHSLFRKNRGKQKNRKIKRESRFPGSSSNGEQHG